MVGLMYGCKDRWIDRLMGGMIRDWWIDGCIDNVICVVTTLLCHCCDYLSATAITVQE